MLEFVSIDEDRVEFQVEEHRRPVRCEFFLYDRQGREFAIALEERALVDLAKILRALSAKFPGAFGLQ